MRFSWTRYKAMLLALVMVLASVVGGVAIGIVPPEFQHYLQYAGLVFGFLIFILILLIASQSSEEATPPTVPPSEPVVDDLRPPEESEPKPEPPPSIPEPIPPHFAHSYALQENFTGRVAEDARPRGVFWWSFYEREARFSTFLDEALIYASSGNVDLGDR